MMKFAKFFAYLTACLSVVGCDVADDGLNATYYYREICVDGVVYLRSPNGNLTPKVNSDFYPMTCVMKEKDNG